jgi:hypothetical protein
MAETTKGVTSPSPISITIPELPVGTGIELSYEKDGTREVALCDFDEPIALSIASGVQISGDATTVFSPSSPVRALVLPRQIVTSALEPTLCRHTAMLRLKFIQIGSGDLELSRNLIVNDLELYERPDLGEPISTLVSGQFRLATTNAPPTALFSNDLLDMGRPSGRMRTMVMGERTVRFNFQGVVHSLSLGSSTSQRSAMPSVLEWWLSRERIWVAWSAGLSAIAFLGGLYQWIAKRA